MKLARPATSVIVGWTVVLLLGAAFASVLFTDRWPSFAALPLMFSTLYTGLALGMAAAALGLRGRQAAFCQAWCITLIAQHNSPAAALDSVLSWSASLRGLDYWSSNVLLGLCRLLLATFVGTLAAVVWHDSRLQRFHFRLWHVFVLVPFVGATCLAWQDPNRWTLIATSCLLLLQIVAGLMAAAGRGNVLLAWGFLVGSFAMWEIQTHTAIIHEWEVWLEIALARLHGPFNPSDPFGNSGVWKCISSIMTIYTGLFTGVLAAIFYRPQAQDAKASSA